MQSVTVFFLFSWWGNSTAAPNLIKQYGKWKLESFFGDRHSQGILLLHTYGMAVHPNSSLVFEGDDTFFYLPQEGERGTEQTHKK